MFCTRFTKFPSILSFLQPIQPCPPTLNLNVSFYCRRLALLNCQNRDMPANDNDDGEEKAEKNMKIFVVIIIHLYETSMVFQNVWDVSRFLIAKFVIFTPI